MTPRKRPWPPLPLNVTLLLAMLTVVLVSIGGMFGFSSLALQREFRKLPADIQTYLRARDEALRRGETPPPPPTRGPSERTPPGTEQASTQQSSTGGSTAPGTGTPGTSTLGSNASDNRARRAPWPIRQVDWLRSLQRQLLQIGLIAVAVSTLLALWLARRIARPVSVVSRAAEQLAAGDLSVRVPVPALERELATLARSFNGMAQNLEHLEAERQQAVADIAHELRTPLAIMQARLDAIEDGIYPMNADQITHLSTQTQLLIRLVGDLRTLTLLEANQLALNLKPTDLTEVARTVTNGLQTQALGRGILLNVMQWGTVLVSADADRLRQVLSNLIENALRHASQQVNVTVAVEDAQAVVHVDDDGTGIPADKLQQVFTRFTRLDESRTRDAGGSGLGLSIVQALCAAHGGRASAQASALGGARFSIALPLLIETAESTA